MLPINSDVIHILLAASVLLAAARFMGWMTEKISSPRVIGEIAAGILLGPTFFQWFAPGLWNEIFSGIRGEDRFLSVLYWLGFTMLMFISGYELKLEWKKEYRRLTLTLVLLTTTLPFIAGILFTRFFHWESFFGAAAHPLAFSLVMGIAFAVISIPVISKIFFDLGISHTSFAQINLTIAGIHDLFLWVTLALAVALVQGGNDPYSLYLPLITTTGLVLLFAWIFPFLLSRLHSYITGSSVFSRVRENPTAFAMILLWVTVSLAGSLQVDMMFGALAAGLFLKKLSLLYGHGGMGGEEMKKVSLAAFVPLYFALVGFQLDLLHHFPILPFLTLLVSATLIQGTLVFAGARLTGQSVRSALHFAAALNARGGPGIVLATVAYQAKLINLDLFAMLVMLSLVTSWLAGTWLKLAIRSGRPLMDEK